MEWDDTSETEEIARGKTGGEYPARALIPNTLITLQRKIGIIFVTRITNVIKHGSYGTATTRQAFGVRKGDGSVDETDVYGTPYTTHKTGTRQYELK